jgi:hypothetical protein
MKKITTANGQPIDPDKVYSVTGTTVNKINAVIDMVERIDSVVSRLVKENNTHEQQIDKLQMDTEGLDVQEISNQFHALSMSIKNLTERVEKLEKEHIADTSKMISLEDNHRYVDTDKLEYWIGYLVKCWDAGYPKQFFYGILQGFHVEDDGTIIFELQDGSEHDNCELASGDLIRKED